jgi:hypothetical protein
VSAVLQFPSYLEQPRATPTPPPKEQDLAEQQSIASKKPSRAVGLIEESYWLRAKQEVPADRVTKGLDDVYVIDDRDAVISFIEKNRLRGLLLLAREPLNAAFGDKTVKNLSMARDDEGVETLFCLVMTAGAMQDARQALRRFDQQWWLALYRHVSGKLNFDFELI